MKKSVHTIIRPLRRHAIALGVSSTLGAFGASAQALPQVVVNATLEEPYAPSHASVGGKTPVRLIDVPQSVTVFSAQRIQDQNLLTLGDLLQQAPGVSVRPFDGANPDYNARGFSLESSYDGIPVTFGGSGTQEFELAMFERVEVLRGPAGVTQGNGNPGGLINFVRKRGLRDRHVSAAASVGSWNNRRVELDAGGALNEAGTLRARAVATFNDRDYFFQRAHDRKWLGYLALDADIAPGTVLSASFARQVDNLRAPYQGLPAYLDGGFLDVPRETSTAPGWNRFAWSTNESSLELAYKMNSGWELRARAIHRTVDKFYKDGFPSTGVTRTGMTVPYNQRASALDFQRTSGDLFASGPFALFGRTHTATVGYNYDTRLSSSVSTTYAQAPRVDIRQPDRVPEPQAPTRMTGSDSQVTQSGVYAQARLSLADAFTLALGARASNYRNENRAIAPSPVTQFATTMRERGEVTPSVALLWHVNRTPNAEVNAYVSYADIFAAQTAMDANRRVLDPRVGGQVELGVKGNFLGGRLTASGAVFNTRERNRALATGVADVFSPSGEVEVRGVEFEVGGRPMASLNLSAGYTWLSTEYGTHPTLEGTNWSTSEPKHSLKLYARWQPAWMQQAFIGGGVVANSAMLGGGVTGLREGSGYAIANAQLGYALGSNASITLSVNNLFDRNYYSRVGGLNSYNTVGDPRNVLLSVRGSY